MTTHIGPQPETKPEFIRLPKANQACPYTALKRGKLNELILPSEANGFKPPVRSISVRNRGQKKGCRLIVYDSLVSYLRSLDEAPKEAEGLGKAGVS